MHRLNWYPLFSFLEMVVTANRYHQESRPQNPFPDVGLDSSYKDGSWSVSTANDADGTGTGDIEGDSRKNIRDNPTGNGAEKVKSADNSKNQTSNA